MKKQISALIRRLWFRCPTQENPESPNHQIAKSLNLRFTLIELLAAMGVLMIIMFVLLSFFSSAQQAWTLSNARAEVYENARIALDLITRDLQCAYYVEDKTPFWHGAYPDSASWGDQGINDIIAFVSATSSPPNDDATSRLCEIKYQKMNAATHSSNSDGWLRRSCTGDKLSGGAADAKWNFYNNIYVRRTGATTAFSANSDSSQDFEKVIPHVIELSFICYDKNGNDISAQNYNHDDDGDGVYEIGVLPGKSTDPAANQQYPTPFPYAVKISLTLMDKASWDKWVVLDADPYDATTQLTTAAKGAIEDVPAWEFRQKNQRTFTKTIFLGERGQKY
jgi:type II secretory pathway component PulJ